jgi:hypothetical protein
MGSCSEGGGGGEGAGLGRWFRARISLITRILAIKKPREIATLFILSKMISSCKLSLSQS